MALCTVWKPHNNKTIIILGSSHLVIDMTTILQALAGHLFTLGPIWCLADGQEHFFNLTHRKPHDIRTIIP